MYYKTGLVVMLKLFRMSLVQYAKDQPIFIVGRVSKVIRPGPTFLSYVFIA